MKVRDMIANCPVGRNATLQDPADTVGESSIHIEADETVHVLDQQEDVTLVRYAGDEHLIPNITVARWNEQDDIQAT